MQTNDSLEESKNGMIIEKQTAPVVGVESIKAGSSTDEQDQLEDKERKFYNPTNDNQRAIFIKKVIRKELKIKEVLSS